MPKEYKFIFLNNAIKFVLADAIANTGPSNTVALVSQLLHFLTREFSTLVFWP